MVLHTPSLLAHTHTLSLSTQDDLKRVGSEKGWCPILPCQYAVNLSPSLSLSLSSLYLSPLSPSLYLYPLSLSLSLSPSLTQVEHANVVVFNYSYLLDPKIA